MKKYLRITALIITALLCCLIFAGCNGLDELKATHAYWGTDGSIIYNGSEYILLPESVDMYPVVDYNATSIDVTEEDVPVLLSSILSDYSCYLSEDGAILAAEDIYDYTTVYYCREDRYAEVLERINSGFVPEGYCYDYYDWDKSEDIVYMLTEEETEAVAAVKDTVEPTVVPSSAEVYYDYTVYLYECSKDLLFRREAFEICTSDGEYCIVEYNENGDTVIYQVPDEYKSEFDSIFSAYINAENYWGYDDYYEEDMI